MGNSEFGSAGFYHPDGRFRRASRTGFPQAGRKDQLPAEQWDNRGNRT
jgi:hypothetical protein